MDNIQVFLTLVLIRLIIPFGILLLIGEWERNREAHYRFRNEHLTDSVFGVGASNKYSKTQRTILPMV